MYTVQLNESQLYCIHVYSTITYCIYIVQVYMYYPIVTVRCKEVHVYACCTCTCTYIRRYHYDDQGVVTVVVASLLA